MSRTLNVTVLICLAALAAACTDSPNPSQPVKRSVSAGPSYDQVGSANGTYICDMSPTPQSVSLYVGGTVSVNDGEVLCDDNTNMRVQAGEATATAQQTVGFSTTVLAHADGTTGMTVEACCDQFGQWAAVTVPVTVTHPPLAPIISGESNVNTNRSCTFDAGPGGGYPPYTYSWSVDGTIVGGQGTEQITARFGSDGSHLVSVSVTDAHSQNASGNLWVTSSTQSPPELSCPVT